MIGRLTGILLEKSPPSLLIDVNGVGYELQAPMTTFYQLPDTGDNLSLFTHLIIREDAHTLYGFAHESDREWFRLLIKVNGVGAKMALALLSGLSHAELIRVIQNKDVPALTAIPGVGKKTAERLLVELSDKLKQKPQLQDAPSAPTYVDSGPNESPVYEATSALIALGYKPNEASRMIRAVESDGLASEAIIREALRQVAKVSS